MGVYIIYVHFQGRTLLGDGAMRWAWVHLFECQVIVFRGDPFVCYSSFSMHTSSREWASPRSPFDGRASSDLVGAGKEAVELQAGYPIEIRPPSDRVSLTSREIMRPQSLSCRCPPTVDTVAASSPQSPPPPVLLPSSVAVRAVRLEWRRWLRRPPSLGLRFHHHLLFPPPSLWLCYRRFLFLEGTSVIFTVHPRGPRGGGNGCGGLASD